MGRGQGSAWLALAWGVGVMVWALTHGWPNW